MREPLDGVVALYSSTIRRAIETAELLADSLGADSIAQDCGLCELHDGVVDGLPVDQVIEEVWRPRSRSSVRLPWGPNAQDGESIPDLVARASSALWRIVHDHSAETVVVATHGGVIRSSFLCFGDESFRSAWARSPQNASITEWIVPIPEPGVRQLGPGSTYSGARLVRYDDVVHLDQ